MQPVLEVRVPLPTSGEPVQLYNDSCYDVFLRWLGAEKKLRVTELGFAELGTHGHHADLGQILLGLRGGIDVIKVGLSIPRLSVVDWFASEWLPWFRCRDLTRTRQDLQLRVVFFNAINSISCILYQLPS